MDYSKLTEQERINALLFHRLITNRYLPPNWVQLLQSIKIEPGAEVAVELIDLYIAEQLYKSGIEIPNELTIDVITPDYYKQLAPVIYLPSEFSPENRERAGRIIRIIKSLIQDRLKPAVTNIIPTYPITTTITPTYPITTITPTYPITRATTITPTYPITTTITPTYPITTNITPTYPITTTITPTYPITTNITPTYPVIRATAITPTYPVTTATPITRAPVTTAPVITTPITRAPVTTAPITTAPVITTPITTAPITTAGTKSIEILPVVYTQPGEVGDFSWMITRPEYDDVLFIFNDNEEQWLKFVNTPEHLRVRTSACTPGGGNAIIRPYQCMDPPRAAGIPTGKNQRGYQNLFEAETNIYDAFTYIIDLLMSGRYKRVAYSAAPDGRTLGTSIFSPSKDVKEFIVTNIEALSTNPSIIEALNK
jgi:hypothetical protein